ncbi:unnamed protein product [Rotaria sp. Silwood2]|nr:unnamed protein product [Rotaria sp. Silwood2]CAF4084079.1 unnamed protein product [Rotaria sp. Silwood2]
MRFLRKNNISIQTLVNDACCQTDTCDDEIQETEHVDALDQLNICDPFTRLNSDDLLDQKRLTDITSATTTVSSELPFSSTLGEYLYQEVLLTNTFHIYIKSCREIVNLT